MQRCMAEVYGIFSTIGNENITKQTVLSALGAAVQGVLYQHGGLFQSDCQADENEKVVNRIGELMVPLFFITVRHNKIH